MEVAADRSLVKGTSFRKDVKIRIWGRFEREIFGVSVKGNIKNTETNLEKKWRKLQKCRVFIEGSALL